MSFVESFQEDAFISAQISVSVNDYHEAINVLLKHAKSDTSGSRVCAQVLLSLYNSYDFQMNLTDFGLLESKLFYHAMIAIRGRVLLRKEPHEVIENGGKIFENLSKSWKCLNVENRYTS